MTSRTDILKRACIKLGVARPSDYNEESEPARVARDVWPTLAKSELRKHAWSFAISATSLGRIADPTAGQFDAAFNVPTDLLRIVQFNDGWGVNGLGLVSDGSSLPYSIEGRTLYANDETARVRYIADLSTDTSKWDATFTEAFICALAIEMAPTLTKDKQKVRDLKQDYRQAINDARRANAIETPPQEVQDGSWTVARFL